MLLRQLLSLEVQLNELALPLMRKKLELLTQKLQKLNKFLLFSFTMMCNRKQKTQVFCFCQTCLSYSPKRAS